MDKQSLLTLIIVGAVVAFVVWRCTSSPDEEDDESTTRQTMEEILSQDGGESFGWGIVSIDKEQPSRLGSIDPESGYFLSLDVNSRGASIDTIHLSQYFETVEDKHLFEKSDGDVDKYRKALQDREDCEGFYGLVHPVKHEESIHKSISTEIIRISGNIKGEEDAQSVKKVAVSSLPGKRHWEKISEDKDEKGFVKAVTYELAVAKQDSEGIQSRAITIQKTYSIEPQSYSVDVSTKIINHTKHKLTVEFCMSGPTGLNREDPRSDLRYAALGIFREGQIEPDFSNDKKELEDLGLNKSKRVGAGNDSEPVAWMGYINKYFAALLYVKPREDDSLYAVSCKPVYYFTPVRRTAEERTWKPSVIVRDLALAPAGGDNSTETVEFDLFAGPKHVKIFNEDPLYDRLRYIDTVSTRGCFCSFDWLREGLMWLLGIFSSYLFLGNYGLAIILLVAIVRVILHPLTRRGQISMAKTQKQMATFKPELDRIKKKYANDKQAMNKEMMKLYKEHGNPMSGMMLGCLPMFLQLPIWIALFTGLNTNVDLRHEGLLPIWLTDLSAPDGLIAFGAGIRIPLLSSIWGEVRGFNLLPLLLTVAMFLQTKFSSQTTQAATPEQASQQKMMKIMMPIMMLLFFYNAPSGLNLYIMVSTFVGVTEQYFIRKHIREKEQLEASAETVVSVSGKGPRDSRPKKPKGPMWFKRS